MKMMSNIHFFMDAFIKLKPKNDVVSKLESRKEGRTKKKRKKKKK